MKFRNLTVDEIECRIARVKKNGLSLLLYKDARCDMKILDETVGEENWQRDHKECKGNLFCGISIFDESKKEWVTKWDCGSESYTEKEKGEASDSFKRAGFNWGIGRELYTSPFIWITSSKCQIDNTETRSACYDDFEVSHIKIEDKIITELKIMNKTTGIECYSWKKEEKQEPIKDNLLSEIEAESLHKFLREKGLSDETIEKTLTKGYGVNTTRELKKSQYAEIIRKMDK